MRNVWEALALFILRIAIFVVILCKIPKKVALCSIFDSEAASLVIVVLLVAFYLLRGTKPKQKKATRPVPRPIQPETVFIEDVDFTSDAYENTKDEKTAKTMSIKESRLSQSFADEGIRATESIADPVKPSKATRPQIRELRKAFIIGEILNRKQF